MARSIFLSLGGVVAFITTDDGDYGPTPSNTVFDVYDAYTGGSAVTDLQTVSGTTITQVSVPPNTIPVFKAPDGFEGMLFLQDTVLGGQRIPCISEHLANLVGTGAVSSVAGRTGAVTLTSADIGGAGTAGKNVLAGATTDDVQTAAGLTATGKAFAVAASQAAAQTALGASTKGKELITAADAAAVRTAAGVSSTGSGLATAASQDAAQTALGLTTLGKALGVAASAVAARTALSAPSQAETDLKIKAIVGGTAFQFGKGPLANRPAPGTPGLEDGALWLETAP